MEKNTYQPYANAFFAIIYFHAKKDGTPYTIEEKTTRGPNGYFLNAKPFPGDFDSYRTKEGLYIHSDKKGLEKLGEMVVKWKKNILGGYIKARTGETIYTWGNDCIFIQKGIPYWEYKSYIPGLAYDFNKKYSNVRTHCYLAGVSILRNPNLPEIKPLPANITTLNTIDYEKQQERKQIYVNQDHVMIPQLTAGQKLRQKYGT